MTTYCEYVRAHPEDECNRRYHDEEYGFPLVEDDALLERLALEINQAGLSWITILKKKDNFQHAFEGFEVARLAAYGEKDIARLLADAGIIRNRRKIEAVIENARRILEIQKEHGSFKAWLDSHYPRNLEEWVKLFKQTFVFTGGEIVGEFMVSTGYLPGAHDPDCPAYKRIAKLHPAWM